jgi:hypothetical protein
MVDIRILLFVGALEMMSSVNQAIEVRSARG